MKVLLDTGPWVALIDKSESKHLDCVNWFKSFSGALYSTEAVLTEVLHLLNFSIQAQSAALDFVLKTAVEIVPSNIGSLLVCKDLMNQYADLLMDFADATLICLAKETGIRDIATLNRKDFSVYRMTDKCSFTIHP